MAFIGWLNSFKLSYMYFFILLSPCICQHERKCVAGLASFGYTEPRGEIYIEYGDSLNITCVLSAEFSNPPHSSESIYFVVGDTILNRDMVTVINKTSAILHVEKPRRSSSVYFCKDSEGVVCLNQVIVDTKPQSVENFKCIGYNYENLTCTWNTPKTFAKTKYNLTYRFNGRRSMYYSCPNLTENEEERKAECVWTILTNPQYRQAQRTFYFELHMSNYFGTNTFNYTFSHFPHVLSGAPEKLQSKNTTPSSIYLFWEVPNAMQTFPPGLHYRIIYQSEYEKVWKFGGTLNTTNMMATRGVHFNLTGLKYAFTLYDIRVSMRSAEAAINDESMWSNNASITVRTSAKPPKAPPKTNIGSFEIVSTGTALNNTDLYVYWQKLKDENQNGPNFSYEIFVEGDKSLKPVEMTQAYAKFVNLSSMETYKFHIRSRNSIGYSKKYSNVTVPSYINRVGEPVSFIKTTFGDGKYELSWDLPRKKHDHPIKSYTIFWCPSERDWPYQCAGYLNWVTIPGSNKTYNITVHEVKVTQFAISANTEHSSSGMVWAACTVIHSKAIGKMKNVWLQEFGSTFIELRWKLDCSDHIGSVTGYVIYYCAIISPSDASCKEPERNVTISGDSTLDHANITGLKPYETYVMAISVLSKHSQSQNSEFLYQTTLEDAPTIPTNLTILEVTNTTITIGWKRPRVTNGLLTSYIINYNGTEKTPGADQTNYTLENLESYASYKISMMACTVACSEATPSIIVVTKIGIPSKIPRPGVGFQNNSCIIIYWESPVPRRGNTEIYEVNFRSKLEDGDEETVIINTTNTNFTIQNCGENGKYNTFYVSVRAVNLFGDKRYEGPWSDELTYNCQLSTVTWYLLILPIGIILIGLFYFLGKKIHIYCKDMQNLEVKLPPGLAPAIDVGLDEWSASKKPQQEEKIDHSPADEELLLVKLSDARTLSGESSGCSSGHASVTSSLETATHLSDTSDSGTEQCTASTEDLHRTNSLRLRNVASIRPVVSKGYVTMPMPMDIVNAPNWNCKNSSPGGYCVLGVDPAPLTSVSPTYVPVAVTQSDLGKISPYVLSDTLTTQPYVMTGELTKSVNPGYVSINPSDSVDNKSYMPDLVRLDSNIPLESDTKPLYVQVANTSNLRKPDTDSFSPHQLSSIDVVPKTGYVTIGETPVHCGSEPSKGYVSHRHFEAKSLKED